MAEQATGQADAPRAVGGEDRADAPIGMTDAAGPQSADRATIATGEPIEIGGECVVPAEGRQVDGHRSPYVE
jgi:hypothetical protein